MQKPILEGGACGVAVISAIAHVENPSEAAQQFKHLWIVLNSYYHHNLWIITLY